VILLVLVLVLERMLFSKDCRYRPMLFENTHRTITPISLMSLPSSTSTRTSTI
jgi:hypothetical protein